MPYFVLSKRNIMQEYMYENFPGSLKKSEKKQVKLILIIYFA